MSKPFMDNRNIIAKEFVLSITQLKPSDIDLFLKKHNLYDKYKTLILAGKASVWEQLAFALTTRDVKLINPDHLNKSLTETKEYLPKEWAKGLEIQATIIQKYKQIDPLNIKEVAEAKKSILVLYAKHGYATNVNIKGLEDFINTHTSAKYQNADLSQSNLSYLNFKNADLSHANLHDSQLDYADFSDANLTAASLKGANLSAANFTRCWLKDAKLQNTDLHLTNLSNANLENADLSFAILHKTNLSKAKLKAIKCENANFSEVQFLPSIPPRELEKTFVSEIKLVLEQINDNKNFNQLSKALAIDIKQNLVKLAATNKKNWKLAGELLIESIKVLKNYYKQSETQSKQTQIKTSMIFSFSKEENALTILRHLAQEIEKLNPSVDHKLKVP